MQNFSRCVLFSRISLHDFNSVLGNTVKLHTNQSKSQASQPVTCRRVERVVLQVEPELVDGVVGVERVALAQVLLLLHQTSVHRRVDAAHVLVDVCVHLTTSEHVVNTCEYVNLYAATDLSIRFSSFKIPKFSKSVYPSI